MVEKDFTLHQEVGNKIEELNKETLMQVLSLLWPVLWRIGQAADSEEVEDADLEILPGVIKAVRRIRDVSGWGKIQIFVENRKITGIETTERESHFSYMDQKNNS